jgi:hypothetical protein
MLNNDTLEMICDERLSPSTIIQVEYLNGTRNRVMETVIGQILNTRFEDGDILVQLAVIAPDYYGMTIRLSRANIIPIGEDGKPIADQSWNLETYGQSSLTPDVVKQAVNTDWDAAAAALLG